MEDVLDPGHDLAGELGQVGVADEASGPRPVCRAQGARQCRSVVLQQTLGRRDRALLVIAAEIEGVVNVGVANPRWKSRHLSSGWIGSIG